MSNVSERVKKIVVEHLGVEEAKVVDSASFIDDLGADSLDTVELVMAFEEEFSCSIPDDADFIFSGTLKKNIRNTKSIILLPNIV